MRKLLSIIVAVTSSCAVTASAQTLYFPPIAGSTWESVSPATLGWNQAAIDSLRKYLAANGTRAFIVLQDGKIAIEEYFGTFTKDSAWYWASAGKTLTALMIGMAQEERALSITDTSTKWLGKGWTSTSDGNEARITVRHHLTMTTGLDDGVADPYCTEKPCLLFKADPGTRWAYHNAPYTLLDSVLRSATGMTLNQFFITKIAAKTGMTGAFFRSGYNNVFASTARSMARFALLVLNRCVWGTTPVLSDTAYVRAMTSTSQQLNLSYGYLWWLNGKSSFMLPQSQIVFPGSLNPSAPPDMVAALGKNGQFINVVPSRRLVFVRMGDAPDDSMVPFMMNEEIWKRLNAVFSGTDVSPYRLPIPEGVALHQNYPNPFNSETILRFELPRATDVRLEVFDLLGRPVATLVDGPLPAGFHSALFDARALASGTYIARLDTGQATEFRLMVLLR